MPKTRVPYPPEFREQILGLYQTGRTITELAREFEPSAHTIRTWIKEAGLNHAERPAEVAKDERAELARLRREVQQLRLERDILAKAAAWFARETESVPAKSTCS
jgi:transposase